MLSIMSSFRFLVLTSGFLLIGLLSQVSSARKTEILDHEREASNIETIARAVCSISVGTGKQISHYSTIIRLASYFQSLEPIHELAKCARTYLPAFKLMESILRVGNEDVCSSSKIELVEKFHHNFVSKVRKYKKEQKANHLAVPKLLKLFYMHYVSAISSVCAQAAKEDLEFVAYNRDDIEQDTSKVMNPFFDLFGKLESSKDMFLVWNFIDSLPVENTKLAHYLHPGSTSRIFLQVHTTNAMAKIRDACQKDLKPFYSRSILPVIRLADLGFYPKNEELVQMINSNHEYTDFYAVVQLCETFLPLQITKDASLQPDQIVVLSTEESTKLDQTESSGQEKVYGVNPANKVGDLKTIENDDSQAFIKKVKADVDSRISVQNKILRGLIRRFKSQSSHKSNRFTLSDGHSNEDLESILLDSLPKIDEYDPLGPIANAEDVLENENVPIVREKRGVIKFIRKALALIVAGFLTIGYVTLWLVLAVAKAIIFTPFFFVLMISKLLHKLTGMDKDLLPNLIDKGLHIKLPKFHFIAYEKIAGNHH